jgi:hypothetical protein
MTSRWPYFNGRPPPAGLRAGKHADTTCHISSVNAQGNLGGRHPRQY